MGAQEFALPEKATIQVFGRALTRCHAFTAFAIILGNPTTGDGINEILVTSSRLMGFRCRQLSLRLPLSPNQYLLSQEEKRQTKLHAISLGLHSQCNRRGDEGVPPDHGYAENPDQIHAHARV